MKNDPTKMSNRKPTARKSPIQEMTGSELTGHLGEDDVSDLFSRDSAGRMVDASTPKSNPHRTGAISTAGHPEESEESQLEVRLRPKRFDEFPGQDVVKQKLSVFLQAAKLRGEPLDHTLLSGPPGLGKTTLAHILAAELGVDIKSTSGPALDKKGDVAAILTSLKPNSILFIDEIHRLNKHVEEYLYSAMEDFFIDIITGEGWGARTMRFQLAPFTLIGATTRTGLLNAPFRDRFGIVERLQFYNPEDLQKILARSAELLKIEMHPDGGMEIARRCRGTPRIANRLLKRVRDYAQVKGTGQIDQKIASYALGELDVDHRGLDAMDRRILRLMIEKLNGGPAGIDTLSAALSEERDTLEEVYEPFLIQEGFLQKTPRGRVVTRQGYEHLKISVPRSMSASITVIEEQVDFDIT